MVETVKDWETIEAYSGYKQGFYLIISDQKATEIRVNVGRLGFKKNLITQKIR